MIIISNKTLVQSVNRGAKIRKRIVKVFAELFSCRSRSWLFERPKLKDKSRRNYTNRKNWNWKNESENFSFLSDWLTREKRAQKRIEKEIESRDKEKTMTKKGGIFQMIRREWMNDKKYTKLWITTVDQTYFGSVIGVPPEFTKSIGIKRVNEWNR